MKTAELSFDTHNQIQNIAELPKGTGHIMLVDDEKPILEICKSDLEFLGYKVWTFSHPEEALRAFYEDPGWFDVVLVDQMIFKRLF